MIADTMGRRVVVGLLVYLLAALLAFPGHLFAMPQGGQVVSGQAQISQTDSLKMAVNQATSKAIINWQQFSIARPEAVRFFQPSISAVALNRVVGVDPSAIYGQLTANGSLFLINPNGILVGPTGRIETNNFIASTLDMANRDFLDGNYTFIQDPTASLSSILNQGLLQANPGGSVSLIAPAVENQGTIVANLGKVNLGAGEQATLSFAGNDLIRFAVGAPVTGQVTRPDGTVIEDNVLNTGRLSADGGEVVLSARSAFQAVKSVVNNTGVIEAKTLENQNGAIRLDGGDHGIVTNSGTLDASGLGDGETGGRVEVTGEKTALVHYSKILASGNTGGGEVFVGGGFQGKDPQIKNGKITYV
ncbi:MAG: filamentous hemagglutinin N-terminal domain-containing protein, partial [Desulfobacterales bacterium]